ncbi:ABC transporter substrate-binding protein [Microbacterium sp. JB110]|uniref:ABC transporter substrate-binding protein n=1 Tax=Microbacterium sp. JB110 TaxID=2024477 RepID=UPI00097EE8C1|nr:sugar ABC transporter substrate-binding protein [Microbacterium sp. JB110]RCS60082.1 sugar ABC transporter substrate-binding protein [Microbacterium sp. JB110]SJM45529.1 putative sugar ABC transporter, substrate-binding protein [Frigoribacterium sp. JB110]
MRKLSKVAAGTATAGALVLLTACSGGSDNSSSGDTPDPAEVSGTVTFWPYPFGEVNEATWWQPHIENFNEEYPDVEIDLQLQAYSGREESLVTSISGGTEPDVVYFNPDFIPKYAVEDLLLPLDDMRDDWDSFHDSALDAMSYDDTLYGAPQLVSVQTNFCNVAILEEADVECPTTWDELREIAPAVKDAGHYVTNYYGTGNLNASFYQYLWQADGEVLNDDMTEATFNGPEGVKALKLIKEMADNEWIPREEIATIPPFEQSEGGKGNVAYNGGGNVSNVQSILGEDAVETVPPMQDAEPVIGGTVGGWSIFNTTDVPDAAKAWVSHLTDTEFLDEFLPASDRFYSPRTDTADLYTDNPALAAGAEYVPDMRAAVQHPAAREIIDIIKPHIQSVLLEDADPQEALDAAADEVNRIL